MARTLVSCTKDTWVKVATNATSGVININQWNPDFYTQTYVANAAPAPADDTNAVKFISRQLIISSASGIDVYVKCHKQMTVLFIIAILQFMARLALLMLMKIR